MNLISVVIPTFNAELYVAASIESALAQNDPCFEIIVVDDGSRDRTLDIVRRYTNRVTLVEQDNKGAAIARNVGLAHARGHYVAFLDADDLWVGDKLIRQRRIFERFPDLVAVAGRLQKIDAAGRAIEWKDTTRFRHLYDQPQHLHGQLLRLGNMIAQSSVMAVKRCVDEIGGWYSRERILSTDYDLWIRLAERGRFYVSSETVGSYRVLERSLSHGSLQREYDGHRRILEMHRQHFTPREYLHRVSRVYLEWAESAFVRGETGAWTVMGNALKMDPLNFEAWRLGAKQAVAPLAKPLVGRWRQRSEAV
jgi:glycosyltransferase involved in cell wall biosynthesis